MEVLRGLVVLVPGEIAAVLLFTLLRRVMTRDWKLDWVSIGKGVLERIVLMVGLLCGYPQIIIAFGALKLGTRLHDKSPNPISNNYFLVGNLLSILLAMLYTVIAEDLILGIG